MARFIPPRNLTGEVYQAFVSLSKFLATNLGGGGVPPGTITAFGGTSAPTGWLFCDGSSVLRATYPDLFAAIGTTWGSVDGTHFTLPDLRGRAPIGAGTGTGLTARALATGGGEENHLLTTSEMPSHTHTVESHPSGTEAAGFGLGASASFTDRVMVSASPGVSSLSAGAGLSHNNMQPWRAVNYIIAAT